MAATSQHNEAKRAMRDFLLALTQPAQTPAVPEEIRRRAAYLLEYYSSASDLESKEQKCTTSLNSLDDVDNNAGASDMEKSPQPTWVGRLWEDPQRTRNIVANAGIVAGLVAIIALAVENIFLR